MLCNVSTCKTVKKGRIRSNMFYPLLEPESRLYSQNTKKQTPNIRISRFMLTLVSIIIRPMKQKYKTNTRNHQTTA